MKTRILYTKIWQDELFVDLTPTQKLLFLYYLTNDNIGLTGMYELTDRQTMFDTGLTSTQVQEAKLIFENAGKICFYKNWVYVVNSQRLNGYIGKKLEKAVKKEQKLINADITSYFNRVSKKRDRVSPIEDRSINHKSKIINNKPEIINIYNSLNFLKNIPVIELEELSKNYKCSQSQVKDKAESLYNYCEGHGKRYKNYKSMLQNALLNDYGRRKEVGEFKPDELAPEISLEERSRNRKRYAEMKKSSLIGSVGKNMTDEEVNTRQNELRKQAQMLN